MGYAVELFFDIESERAVQGIWDGIGEVLGKPSLSELGARPHVSLAVYDGELDAAGFPERLLEFAKSMAPFEFRLSSIGTFARSKGVVFLAPVATRQMLAFHERFHAVFSRYDVFGMAYCRPGRWVPHCTVAIELSASEVGKAVAYCGGVFRPVRGRFQEIGLVEFLPVRERLACKLG